MAAKLYTPVSRRRFLTGTAAGLGAMGLGPLGASRLARAAEALDRYFVFLYFEGGWDHLLGLDPRDPADFPDDAAAETGIELAYGLLAPSFPQGPVSAGGMMFGPAIGDLAALTDHFSVVRGINMATLTHEVGRRYFLTGRPPSGTNARGSSVATLAAAQTAADRPVRNLAVRTESYIENTVDPAAAAMSVASSYHLVYLLQESLGIPTGIQPGVRAALEGYWNQPADGRSGAGLGTLADAYRTNRVQARELVQAQLHTHFSFEDPMALASVRAHYGFDPATADTPPGRAALASQALKSGLTRVVSLELVGGLDHHDDSWSREHPERLRQGFDAIARLLEDLRDTEAPGGGSYLDKTTILAFSEFGRTARRNVRGGRDHLLTNCALLA
ncbi:MAG: DUF1501 domain-containing protein, partial [Myxococcota bacterium]|nr:DUF1501 domain-containing protein [Myxococcota bacterium]